MRILRVIQAYPDYIRRFFARHDQTAGYQDLKHAWDADLTPWADSWCAALRGQGVWAQNIVVNAEPMQRAWARENLPAREAGSCSLEDIAVARVRECKPDVLWYVAQDHGLLKRMKEAAPGLRLVLGWRGSITPEMLRYPVWQDVDLVLSCAPESVEAFQARGMRAAHLHHGFDPALFADLETTGEADQAGLTFAGQLMTYNDYHQDRIRLLRLIADAGLPLAIFTPSAERVRRNPARALARLAAINTVRLLRGLGLKEAFLAGLPLLSLGVTAERAARTDLRAVFPGLLKPPVYGRDLARILAGSLATLNPHANASPRFASNMRLFEAAGAGTCQVTDARENLPGLFEPGKELVVYKNSEECLEKCQYLVDNPDQARAMGRAARQRALAEHTYAHRAGPLLAIIAKELDRKQSGS